MEEINNQEAIKLYTLKLDGVEVPDNSEILAFINMIEIPPLKAFVIEALSQYGTEEKLFEANEVADVLVEMLKKKKLLAANVHQSFVDVLLASTLLHNLFYNAEDWTTIFTARKVLLPLAQDMGTPEQVTDAIFQTIEAQMGDDTPVPTSRPTANSPTELFAWALWFAKEYEPQA